MRKEGPSAYVEALNFLTAGDKEEAFNKLKEAVAEDTDNVDAYIKLGDLFRERGQVGKAIQIHQYLTVRTTLSPKIEREVYKSLAKDYLAAKRSNKAISVLEELVKLNRADLSVYETLLSLYEDEKRWDEAYEVEKKILELRKMKDKTSLAIYQTYIGWEKMRGGDSKGALAAYKEAIQLDRKCVPALLYLGDIYYQEGRVEQALPLWEKIVAVAPQLAHLTFERLEKAYYDQGNFEGVLKIYRDLLKKNPKDVETLLALSEIYKKKGSFEEALQLSQKAVEYSPHFGRARLSMIEAYREKGEEEEAMKVALSLIQELLEDEKKFKCARCGYKSGEYFFRCPSCKEWKFR